MKKDRDYKGDNMSNIDFKELEAQALNDEVRYWVNHNLFNYLNKVDKNGMLYVGNQSEIEHIIDYLNSDEAPKRLRKMSYKQAKVKSEEWVRLLTKKGVEVDVCEDVDYDVEIDFNDGFRLVKLKSQDAFKREGSLMGHCVSSYFNRKGCSIYSLWDSRDMPHATLELPDEKKEFNQVKGKGNGEIHVKYVKYILESLKHFGVSVRENEMRYLGYQSLALVPEGKLALFKKMYSYQTLTLGKVEYVYMRSMKLRSVNANV